MNTDRIHMLVDIDKFEYVLYFELSGGNNEGYDESMFRDSKKMMLGRKIFN